MEGALAPRPWWGRLTSSFRRRPESRGEGARLKSFLNCVVVSRRIDQSSLAFISSRLAYSSSASPSRACCSASIVLALGILTANGNP